MKTIRLEIAGPAAGAVERIENAIRMVPGVMSVRADPSGGSVHVEAGENVTADDLIAAVQKAGHLVTLAG